MRERSEEKAPEAKDERQQPTRAAETEEQRTARHAAEAEAARVKAEDRRQRFLKAVKWKAKSRLPLRGFLQGVYAATRAAAAFQKAGITLPTQVLDEADEFVETREKAFTLTLRASVTVGEGSGAVNFGGRITGRIGDGEITDVEGITTGGEAIFRLENDLEGASGVTKMGTRVNLSDLQGFEQ